MEPSEYAKAYMDPTIQRETPLYANCALYEFIDQFSVSEINMLISSTIRAITTQNANLPITTVCKFSIFRYYTSTLYQYAFVI